MRDWISVIVAVLGVLLVLAGSALIVMRALASSAPPAPLATPDSSFDESPTAAVVAPAPAPAPARNRLVDAVKNPSPADRLIFWGIILLVLAAIAAGAISFSLGASGGTVPTVP
ncbi:hypothetical protein KZZ52_54585 [Dactylosporangium sp. AC04546]|uniref:hypothetical protein n=1 Tax=Dactylosporangium sp. AC04546 TaxID=2862460 RepID=UPI001EDD85B3|nr:hypothetical protein [Dactylosporangium sp. AC04546]WVK82869.1 hypothetical protein KZZ52_54585 [Dactylosporangium sp. AC04546]